jgi:hypothetical protein
MESNAQANRGNGHEEVSSADPIGTAESWFSETFGDLDERIRTLSRERPFAAVLTAVAVGFVLGRMFGPGGSRR